MQAANQITDSTILNLISVNNLKGWKLLYDRYAPVMYGVICIHTDYKGLADKIFTDLFLHLKERDILLCERGSLCLCIMRYTYLYTSKKFKSCGINYTMSSNTGNLMLHNFCSKYTTTQEVAEKMSMSKMGSQQRIHKEILLLTSENKNIRAIQQNEAHSKHGFKYNNYQNFFYNSN